jgi:hypothetical protein
MSSYPPTLSVQETLARKTQWLQQGTPFYHVRYNDGEWIAMLTLQNGRCARHRYAPIREALRQTHQEIEDRALEGNAQNILMGSNWPICGRVAERFDRYIRRIPGLMESITWCAGDGWYTTQEEIAGGPKDDKGLLALLTELRNHNTVFVCNRLTEQAKHCMNATAIVIPEKDGWEDVERIRRDCAAAGTDTSAWVWCAGFPGKVLSWEVWKARPRTSHIDLGQLFDGAFDVAIANWQRRSGGHPHQGHKTFYARVITPFVLGAIP